MSQTNIHKHSFRKTHKGTVKAQPHNDLPWSNLTNRRFRHFSLL